MQFCFNSSELEDAFGRLRGLIRGADRQMYVVGGSARDTALGLSIGELDLEIFGLSPDALGDLIAGDFEVQRVGAHFPVARISGLPIDIGCVESLEPTIEAAALRRDFTLNALYIDSESGELFDPLDGMADLQKGILRHTGPRFAEDPLRILRGMQLAARFNLSLAPETAKISRGLSLEGIAPERIFEEWRKLLVLGNAPSMGLRVLEAAGALRFFPEFAGLVGCPQDPGFHPEGDVWTHTGHALDAFSRERTGDAREDLVVGLAVLCHDLGKPSKTEVPQESEGQNRIRSPGHATESAKLARQFLERMTTDARLVDQVALLVEYHLAPAQLRRDGAGDSAIRRLARNVRRIDRLVRVSFADHGGRPPLVPDRFEVGGWLLERAEALAVSDSAPKPIVNGHDLLSADLGLSEGIKLGRVLDEIYEAQLDGRVTTHEEGMELARIIVDAGEGWGGL